MNRSKLTIAIFDFDGTITNRDSFLIFLHWTHSQKDYRIKLYRHSLRILAYFLGWCSNQVITEKLLTEFYQGWTIERLQQMAIEFAHQKLPSLLDLEAVNQLKWHQEQGHKIVLVSAALDIYLKPWAEMMHVDQVLGNQLEVQQGYITGKLKGENCYGLEKVKQIENLLGDLSQYYLYAYGDSKADRYMLAIADEPCYRKFGSKQRIMIR